MPTISEKNAKSLIQQHLRERGWPLTDFSVITKGFKDGLGGQEAVYAILRDGHTAGFINTKGPSKDLRGSERDCHPIELTQKGQAYADKLLSAFDPDLVEELANIAYMECLPPNMAVH